ncbi:MAG: hypothetical protein KatS3mg126_1717 [Lysobacteraceae bacterium]|nr:MAG: hypothetical protein KatS3mg126_1717 [Xanthomonadaceae bacterium]
MSAEGTPLSVGPKSTAWLRQVGIRTEEALREAGAVTAFLRVRRAGFRPSLNLLYALEGVLSGCHWREVPAARRQELLAELERAEASLAPPVGRAMGFAQPAAPVSDVTEEVQSMLEQDGVAGEDEPD